MTKNVETLGLLLQSQQRMRLFIIGYSAFLMALVALAAFGLESALHLVDDSWRWGAGICAGALCLLPLLLLRRLTCARVTVSLKGDTLTLVGSGRESVQDLDDIRTIIFEKGKSLLLYGSDGKLLFSLVGPCNDAGLAKLVKNFIKHPAFHKTTKRVTAFGGRDDAVTLTRKTRNSREVGSGS